MLDFQRFSCIIFDLDGTLADTAPDLTRALNHCLQHAGRPPIDSQRVRHLVGHGARALLEKGLALTGGGSAALITTLMPLFLRHYSQHICVDTKAYPGVEAALERLSARGVRLGVCTNKPEQLARPLIAALGWEKRFCALVGGDTLPQRKPHPAPLLETIRQCGATPATTLFVGDSPPDVGAARAAGVRVVVVPFGFASEPASDLRADAVLSGFHQL